MDRRIEFADHHVEVLGVDARVAVVLLGWARPLAVVRREVPLGAFTRDTPVSPVVFTLSDVCGRSVEMGVLAVSVRVSTSLLPSLDLGATRGLETSRLSRR